jgi:hypothetical protein
MHLPLYANKPTLEVFYDSSAKRDMIVVILTSENCRVNFSRAWIYQV